MTRAPYLLVSDIHAHPWSAFSTINEAGLNSRLAIQLSELERAASELLKRGGYKVYFAGDLFHVRGSIDPEVFNPVHATFSRIAASGIGVTAIPGNHDLKGRETTELGNAFQTLQSIGEHGDNFRVVTKPQVFDDRRIAMIPWCASKDKLREAQASLDTIIKNRADYDLIIHAGIDGVLDGVPAGGLSAAEVASWGFKRVFAGDYHNHKVMEGGKVVSIGATTHQSWGDIGSKAGFLFVYDDHIEWQASHAPEFVEISGEDDPDEIPLIVDGNYVRVRGMKLTDGEIKTFRTQLEEMGARGVSFQVAREAVVAREGSIAGAASTLDQSVDKFIDTMTEIDVAAVKAQAADVLSHVRSVAV